MSLDKWITTQREKDERRSRKAAAIADALFTNGGGQKADRLVLELPGKQDGGGWCRDAVRDLVLKHLRGQG